MTDKNLNIFEGPHAVLDFLNPDNASYIPLVELPASLNSYADKGVRIFVKLMNMLPLMNVKSLPAYNMLLDKKDRGELEDVNTVIENSSGNTVFSLAVIARLMGVPRTRAIVSHQVSGGKLKLLRLLGAEVIVNEEPICPDPADPTSGIYKAKVWAKENNWFNPGQYDNEANPDAHEKWTAPQIWEQTKGKVDIVAVGLGTTGTATGLGRYFKTKNKLVKIVGVSRLPNNPIPGVRTENLLKQIAFNWKDYVNAQEEVGTVESFRKSLELCRSGIMVGPSSGFALVGLLNYLGKQKLEELKDQTVVVICPDSPLPYINEYFEYLDEIDFPAIENAHLLQYDLKTSKKDIPGAVKELGPTEAYELLYADAPSVLWDKVRAKKYAEFNDGMAVIDVRTAEEFEEHHMPGAENVDFGDIDSVIKKNKGLKKKEAVLFVCKFGNTSRLAAWKAQEFGIKAVSLKGGDAEWSRLNLPRVRSDTCIARFNLH
jgi:cysteine synthase/rhodanese-related sulfurtransferase